MLNILFLFDAKAFGGHEVTALAAMEGLVVDQRFSVRALHTNRNEHTTRALEEFSQRYERVQTSFVTVETCFSESADALLYGARTRSIARAIRPLYPDLAVNVQGFITIGLCATAACRFLNVPNVSFLPMVHKLWHIRPSFISLVHDLMNKYWYSCPSAYIVTSERMRKKLDQEHFVDKNVSVAEYGPNIEYFTNIDRNTARSALGWDNNTYIGIVGRIEFVQKRQDFFIRTLEKYRNEFEGYKFVIIGDGPDVNDAVRLVHNYKLEEMIFFMGWQSNMWSVYPALDALLIPSRYEGVPLVMMEAMLCRVPVLASDVDGMSDLLPEKCLFREGCGSDMIRKLKQLPDNVTSEILDQLAGLIYDRLNSKVFCESFVREILRIHKLMPNTKASSQ